MFNMEVVEFNMTQQSRMFQWPPQLFLNREVNRAFRLNTFEFNKMATLINISGNEEPQPPRSLATTLKDLNIEATLIVNSKVVDQQCVGPDELHSSNMDHNKQGWWLMLTKEEHESLVSTNTAMIRNIPGSTRMPYFDKVLITPTPQQAATTLYMHLTEGHTATRHPSTWILLHWEQDHSQQALRMANDNMSLFARAYEFPQLQIEANTNLFYTATELSTQVQWMLTPSTEGVNMAELICNGFPWQQGWLWTFNIPMQVQQLPEAGQLSAQQQMALLQALSYSGTQVLQHLPVQQAMKIHNILEKMHSIVNKGGISTKGLKYEGSKTSDRIRGNIGLATWMKENFDEQHVTETFIEINKWRMANMCNSQQVQLVDMETDPNTEDATPVGTS